MSEQADKRSGQTGIYPLTYFQYYYRDDLWKNIRKPNLYLFFPPKNDEL